MFTARCILQRMPQRRYPYSHRSAAHRSALSPGRACRRCGRFTRRHRRFGERHVEEYRIGFTRRGNAEVLHGIVWPLYGEEEASFDLSYTNMEDGPERHSNVNIIDLLKETGIHEIRRHPHRFEPEYCDDCGAPLYADPLGEIVHAGMPEEVETAQPRFH